MFIDPSLLGMRDGGDIASRKERERGRENSGVDEGLWLSCGFDPGLRVVRDAGGGCTRRSEATETALSCGQDGENGVKCERVWDAIADTRTHQCTPSRWVGE